MTGVMGSLTLHILTYTSITRVRMWTHGSRERLYSRPSNWDARFKGKVILSPKQLADISYSGSGAVQNVVPNGGFEAGDLTDWTVESGAATASTDSVYHGTYALKLVGNGAEVTQKLTWDDSLQSTEITFSAYLSTVTTGTGGSIKVGINDGIDTTWSDTLADDDTWTSKTATKTLAANATQLELHIISNVATLASYADACTVTGYSGTFDSGGRGNSPVIIEFGTDIVVASGTKLCKLDTTFVEQADFGEIITDLCVFGDNLYIALGLSNNYWYTSDLSTFTQITITNATAQFMSNVKHSQFWINDTANTMRESDNPVNGGDAFSTAYTMPNSTYNITGLMDNLSAATVYCRKQDQLYYLSGADVLTLIPALSTEANTSISYKPYPWKGNLYIPSGTNSLYEYDDGTKMLTMMRK